MYTRYAHAGGGWEWSGLRARVLPGLRVGLVVPSLLYGLLICWGGLRVRAHGGKGGPLVVPWTGWGEMGVWVDSGGRLGHGYGRAAWAPFLPGFWDDFRAFWANGMVRVGEWRNGRINVDIYRLKMSPLTEVRR